MLDREGLVTQMAKALAGHGALDTSIPLPEERRRAEEALRRVEVFLGTEIEEAKEILTRVLEDVS
jgi:hypothetical protein